LNDVAVGGGDVDPQIRLALITDWKHIFVLTINAMDMERNLHLVRQVETKKNI
jgi:hypothetical protein